MIQVGMSLISMQETATFVCVCVIFYFFLFTVKKIKQTSHWLYSLKKEIPNSLGIKSIDVCVIDRQFILIQHKSVKQKD